MTSEQTLISDVRSQLDELKAMTDRWDERHLAEKAIGSLLGAMERLDNVERLEHERWYGAQATERKYGRVGE